MRAFAVVLLAIAVVGSLIAISGAQASSEEAAKRALTPAISALTDTRRVISTHRTELVSQAEQDKSARLTIPHFPLPVSLSATEVQALPADDLERVVIQQAVDVVYEEGSAAFQRSNGAPATGGFILSTIDQLSRPAHNRYVLAAVVMMIFSVLLGVLLLLGSEPHHGLILLGVSIAIAGIIVFVGSALLSILVGAYGGGGSGVTQIFEDIGQQIVGGARRNGTVSIVLGITLFVFGVLTGVVAAKPRADVVM